MILGHLILLSILGRCSPLFTRRSNSNQCKNFTKYESFPLLHQAGACGDTGSIFTRRIMGGVSTSLGEFPFMALLLFKGSYYEGAFCGGTIINKRYILTAAHCAEDAKELLEGDVVNLVARLGEHDVETDPDCEEGHCAPPVQDFIVEQLIPHEHYTHVTGESDIALLRLDRDIIFNQYISPVCLPFDCKLMADSFEGKTVVVPGWGHLIDVRNKTDSEENARVLQKVEMPVTSARGCQQDWEKRIPKTLMCVGGVREYKGGQDACKGDSGGPLLYTSRLGGYKYRHFQVGIVSSGELCSRTNVRQNPGLYTRVTSFLPWILQNVRK